MKLKPVKGSNSKQPPSAKPLSEEPHGPDRLLKNPRQALLLLPMVLAVIFSALLFEVKISEGNDDSMYIESAWKYAQDFTGYFHRANAPLYPMFLGVITMFTGFNLVLYKLINTVLFLLFIYFLYRAFFNRIPHMVLLPVMLLCAMNSHLLFFASQTYTEIPFLALQSFFLFFFFRWYDKLQTGVPDTKRNLSNTILPQPTPGALTFARTGWSIIILLLIISVTRSIAAVMAVTVLLFLLWEKKYRLMAYIAAGFTVGRVAWNQLVSAVWGDGGQYSSQSTMLMLKNPYNPAEGNETLTGFVNRFFINTDLYISKRLMQVLGFRDEAITTTIPIITVMVVLLTLWCCFIIFKQTKTKEPRYPLYLTVLLLIIPMGVTFILLQPHWETARLIVVFLPLWAVVVFYGLYVSLYQKSRIGRRLYIGFTVLILGSCFITTLRKSFDHFPVLVKNLQGDRYYGYTPDWENYLRMSEWCAENLPPEAVIACRKAPMSFVYGNGREFFPVYTVIAVDPETNYSQPDSVLQFFSNNKVNYVIAASLRVNPTVNNGVIINTLQRMLIPIAQEYPDKIRLVKKIGDSEEAYLYELVY